MEPDEIFIEDLRLRNKQKYVNRMFEEEGLTDKVLMEQIEINKKRNELNIHDPKKIIPDNEGYVQ